jgi:hypothetical protein
MAVGKTGVIVVDILDPENLTEIASLDTIGTAYSLQVVGNTVYVADGSGGLKLLYAGQEGLELINGYDTPGRALDVAVMGSNVFVIDHKEDLLVFKVNDKDGTFTLTSVHDIPDRAEKIKIVGNKAYISNNKNRFMIYDISVPNNPIQINFIDLQSSIENYVIVGNYAYIAAEEMGLVILDVSQETEITIATQYNQIKNASDVIIRGRYAYVAARSAGYAILDISNFEKITEVGRESSPSDVQLVRNVDDFVYVADDLIGLKSFYNPVLFKFREREMAKARGLYEDVIVTGDVAYIAAGESGLKVLNVENLNTPLSETYFDETDDYATALDIQGDYIYVTYRKKGIRQYNIGENPWQPSFEGIEAGVPGEPRDIRVQGKLVYVASGSEGLQIIDLSDIASPGVYSTDTPGTAKGVFVLDNIAYVADGESGLHIITVNDPKNPSILQSVNTFGDATSVYVTKINDINEIERTYAFIANGSAGLLIVDITDIYQPVNVATYSTQGLANDVIVQDQITYLLAENDGLLLLDVTSINDPKKLGNQSTPGKAKRMDLWENQVAFVADYDRGLRIISVSDKNQPKEIGFFDIPATARVILVSGNLGYMVDGQVGMWILDLSDPEEPTILSLYPTPGSAQNLALDGSHAYIADGNGGLHVVNVSNPLNPQFDGTFREIDNAIAVAVKDGYAYVVTGDRKRMHILDIGNLAEIKEISVFETVGDALNIATFEAYAYILEGTDGIEVVNVQDPSDPSITSIGKEFNVQDARFLLFLKNHAFIADGSAGMKVYSLESPAKPEIKYSSPIWGGFATSLTVNGEYVFLAVDKKGIFPFDVLDINKIKYVGIHENIDQEEVDGNDDFLAFSIAALPDPTQGSTRFTIYTTSDVFGLQIFRADGNAIVNFADLYETPGEATFKQVLFAMPRVTIGLITGNPELVEDKIWARLGYMLFGTILFAILFVLYLVLFSQFVLPVQNLREGAKVITRLYSSLKGEHGPVVFIKEGHIIARPDELERRGPGVARVDLNSAIVFEKQALLQPAYQQRYDRYIRRASRSGRIPRARVEGPGVHFFEAYEKIHGIADLRPQFRIRPEVQAYTRDGIEISTPVWILFTLGQPPETIDVTYEGERIAENLRVIHMGEKDITLRESDALNEEESQIFQISQTTRRFFQKAKEILSNSLTLILARESERQNALSDLPNRVKELAFEWQVLNVDEVCQFLDELETLCSTVDVRDDNSVFELIKTANRFADLKLGEIMTDFIDNFSDGKKQRGTIVLQLTDELDPDDREEIHRFLQSQAEIRYFDNIKDLLAKVNSSSSKRDDVRLFNKRIWNLAIRLGIQNRETIQHFIGCVGALSLEIDASDPVEVQWFVYHIRMLSDELAQEKMIHFYDHLNKEMVIHYKEELKELESSISISKFAKQSIDSLIDESPLEDGLRLFNLNAISLHNVIRPELIKKLQRLRVDPANKVEYEMLEKALTRFDSATSNLVRSDYPILDDFSLVAHLQHNFSILRDVSEALTPHGRLNYTDFITLIRLRQIVGKISKTIQALDSLDEPDFAGYIELINIYDFVRFVNGAVTELKTLQNGNSDTSPQLRACVVNIKRRIKLLDQIAKSEFERPVQRLSKWTESLSSKESAEIYFYEKKVFDLWKKIATSYQLEIRQYLKKANRNISQLKREIRRFNIQAEEVDNQGEVRHYKNTLDQISEILQACKIPTKILDPGTKGVDQIRVGPFQFVRRRVLAAIYSKALDIDQAGEYMPWTDLPVHAAAQTYRDLISKEQYDYLYEPKDPIKYNLPKLRGNFFRAMRNQGVLAFRFVDHCDGKPLHIGSEWANDELIYYQSRELKNPKVLRARGIKVIASGFPDLFPVSPKIPEQWLETWRAPLESRAIDIRGKHELQAMRVINKSRAQAQRDMAHTLARILRSSKSDEALAMRVFQALESTAMDQDTKQFLPRETMYLLRSFKQWFLPGSSGDYLNSMGDFINSDDPPLLDE